MRNFFILLIICFLSSNNCLSQSKKEVALAKAKEAVKIMDEGKVDESIEMLYECKKLDPENYIYPSELGYAYLLKKDYGTAIQMYEAAKQFKDAPSIVYQMLGNCHSYAGQSQMAIKIYEEGMKKFPNSGNLYLEKGNIFLDQKLYDEAVNCYRKGIDVQPEFSSNYFRLAKLYLNSNDKLKGLIYGEIFVNIERTTKRTKEISKLLFDTYKSSIIFDGDKTEIKFCEIVVDANEKFKMPLCGIFGKNFILSIVNQKNINLDSLSEIRLLFIKEFFTEDYKNYPNVLFSYQKKMLDENVFNAYNHYIFQMGAEQEFSEWKSKNAVEFDRFKNWYTTTENELVVNDKNKFLGE